MPHLTRDLSDSGGAHGKRLIRRLSRRAVLAASLQALASLVACTASPAEPFVSPASMATSGPVPTIAPGPPTLTPALGAGCAAGLPTVVPPTPIPFPGYAQLETDTGLHVTGGAQHVDLANYRLQVNGLVDHPLSLSYDDLRCLRKVQARVSLECPGYFVDTADLAGPTLAGVLALAGPQHGAARVTLISVNGYSTHFSLEEVQGEDNFLAYEWRGQALPASHGFPLRAALPGKPGSDWVKWLEEIQLA